MLTGQLNQREKLFPWTVQMPVDHKTHQILSFYFRNGPAHPQLFQPTLICTILGLLVWHLLLTRAVIPQHVWYLSQLNRRQCWTNIVWWKSYGVPRMTISHRSVRPSLKLIIETSAGPNYTFLFLLRKNFWKRTSFSGGEWFSTMRVRASFGLRDHVCPRDS